MVEFLVIGVDIGGTFTDAVAISATDIHMAKVPSIPADPGQAVLQAIKALAVNTPPNRLLHSTTLVTNMLLERKGAPTGLITSEGFRDLLHIGRHKRPFNYAIRQEIPRQHFPPVPRKWRLTVPERVAANGEVVVPLDEVAVRTAARQLARDGVEAIAVGFLHSYCSATHEQQAHQWIEETVPGLFVCTSSQVSPRFREYERFMTTAWNARVAPAAARYLDELAANINELWTGLPLTMMTSNGGLEEVRRGRPNREVGAREDFAVVSATSKRTDLKQTPIRLALSGPAAAGNAVVKVAQDLKLSNCVGLDVGGTSSDIVIVREGQLREAPLEEREVGGYPLQIPMLDLHTIGAGGGSLVFRDEYGTLHVGPQSAGADPGPACYNRGGTQPTVTDAALIAGRLPDSVLLGGHFPIWLDLAQNAFKTTFELASADASDPATSAAIALDVLTLAESQIAFAIRERTVARGLNPRDLALVTAGGAGALLACGVADALELAEVVIPRHPGLLAAWGLLAAPDRREGIITILQLLDDISEAELAGFRTQAVSNLAQVPPAGAKLTHTCALRYLGQGFEVDVPLTPEDTLPTLTQRFHATHQHEYGFALPGASVEWVELRVAWEIAPRDWDFPGAVVSGHQVETVRLWEREPQSGLLVQREAQLWQRNALPPNITLPGPVIIVEEDTTIYTATGWQARVVDGGYLRIVRILG
jgi:N-methylhydantoinase A/oxoprolinase/acetone carboxylase beta subunit